jgi:hypothetical protein
VWPDTTHTGSQFVKASFTGRLRVSLEKAVGVVVESTTPSGIVQSTDNRIVALLFPPSYKGEPAATSSRARRLIRASTASRRSARSGSAQVT